jgi:PAS domain S-box-containing protein
MEALRNGYSWSGEMELIRKDGSAFDAIVSNSPVFNDTGNLESIIGVSTDITERRKAEGALEESEKKYRGLFESLPIGLYQSDPSRTLLSINPAALEILGFSQRDELIGEPVMNNFLHEEEREEWLRITANNERVRGYETRIIQPNGSLRWVRLNSRQVKDAHNNVVYFEGSLEDISHQKESDEQISRQMEGLKFLSDTAMEMIQMETPGEIYRAIAYHIHQRLPQAVVVVASFDAETRLARLEAVNGVDHQWEKLRELLGQEPLGMQFEVDNQEQQALLNQYFVRDQEESGKLFQKWFGVDTSEELIRLLHLDNLYGMGLSRDQELFGSVNISLPVGMDLSEREVIQTFITQSATALKKVVAERKLSKQNDDLEEVKKQLWESNQHLEEVNRELNQQQQDLKEALEKAEESDRLKSNFLANLSHEIRTPMNAILGFTHLLKIGDPAPDRKQQFLDIIYSKGEQLMQLINDIIDISKIQSHQFEINWQPLNLNHLLGSWRCSTRARCTPT